MAVQKQEIFVPCVKNASIVLEFLVQKIAVEIAREQKETSWFPSETFLGGESINHTTLLHLHTGLKLPKNRH